MGDIPIPTNPEAEIMSNVHQIGEGVENVEPLQSNLVAAHNHGGMSKIRSSQDSNTLAEFARMFSLPRIPSHSKKEKQPLIYYANSHVVTSREYTNLLHKKTSLREATKVEQIKQMEEREA